MSDYGRPLTFGAFLTPANTDPAQAMGVAMLAEQVGLDGRYAPAVRFSAMSAGDGRVRFEAQSGV